MDSIAMITLTILTIFSTWVSLGVFAKATGKELHLDVTERVAGVLEWIAGWLNRMAAFLRSGAEMYRSLLARDREIRGDGDAEEA